MVDELETLAKTSFCGSLSRQTIEFLRERSEIVTRGRKATFFAEGESGDAVYVLLEGSVAVVKCCGGREVTIAQLAAGDMFGEMALVAIRKRNATVRAETDCTALKLRHQGILDLYHHDPEQFTLLQMNLSREMARRLATANEQLFDARCQGYLSANP